MSRRRPGFSPLITAAVFLSSLARAQTPIPTRTPLATFAIAPGKDVSRVETTRVDFLPGQSMPTHMHTVPVICFVSKGDLVVKIGNAAERPAPLGSVTYEGAGVTVHYFRNASSTQPAQLNCAVLAGPDDKVLNVMLPQP